VSRHAPRRVSLAMAALTDRLAPQTTLADVQRVWPDAVGQMVAREATPAGERGGVLTVVCRSSVWAQELDLMGPELVGRLNEALGGARLTGLRCVASPPRSWAAAGGDDERG
jgi:predicted nucleic acid-binding Zn ribbon protein